MSVWVAVAVGNAAAFLVGYAAARWEERHPRLPPDARCGMFGIRYRPLD